MINDNKIELEEDCWYLLREKRSSRLAECMVEVVKRYTSDPEEAYFKSDLYFSNNSSSHVICKMGPVNGRT